MTTLEWSMSGRHALVTGASAGIGRATALHLASLGASVVVNARRADRLEALVAEIESAGGRSVAVPGDCADEAVIDAMLDAAERFATSHGRVARATESTPPSPTGRGAGGEGSESATAQRAVPPAGADLVVINAGRGLAGSVLTSDASQWDEMIRTNLIAAALLLRKSAERMLRAVPPPGPLPEGGGGESARALPPRDIVVIGSNVGKHVSPFSSMYGSTKFAVGAIAEAARRELGPKGIRVSLVCPGIVVSEFQQVAGYSEDLQQSFRDKFEPLLEADDVARVIGFITSQPAHVHINDVVLRPTRQDYP